MHSEPGMVQAGDQAKVEYPLRGMALNGLVSGHGCSPLQETRMMVRCVWPARVRCERRAIARNLGGNAVFKPSLLLGRDGFFDAAKDFILGGIIYGSNRF